MSPVPHRQYPKRSFTGSRVEDFLLTSLEKKSTKMADSVAVLPAFTFAEKIEEVATSLAHQLPGSDNDRQAWLQSVRESITVPADGAEEGENASTQVPELSQEKKDAVVEKLVKTAEDVNGGLEASERGTHQAFRSIQALAHYSASSSTDVESTHLVFQSLLISDFKDEARYQRVVESVCKGAAKASSRARMEAALRVLIHAYNLTQADSKLRSTILLSTLHVLSSSEHLDVTALPLPIDVIEKSLSAWSLSPAEKVQWLQRVADIYENAKTANIGSTDSLKTTALQLRVLALIIAEGSDQKAVDSALASALKIESNYDLVPVLKVNGVREGMSSEMKELVRLFEENVQLEECLSWVQSHESFLSGLGLSAEDITRKLRLLALVSLCASSLNRDIPYSEVVQTLSVEEDLVEAWVIDAIHANLLKARLSQPKKTLRVQSVASRAFGQAEWKLLEKRLGEWKATLEEVHGVVADAIKRDQEPSYAGGRRNVKKTHVASAPAETAEA
ncbi:hypothetical protein QFC19_008726 [Naganishia cerealis]|uniref:Uncharacterized protein n=1 Tax=Naganishia cerealis TaxID=610337 RepID=A0ACC2UZU8_9TREE|nr:hypothetical protein QFC19_008726 [Naganishia cerealis]